MTQYHLAHFNIARMLAPFHDPIMADFVNNVQRINMLAEASTGFVWRYNDYSTNTVFDEDIFIINMSVWENMEALREYTYYSAHGEFYRRRREWFSKMTDANMVLWWVAVGHEPTLEEAKIKVDHLNEHGATPLAFTFKQRFTSEEMLQFTKQ